MNEAVVVAVALVVAGDIRLRWSPSPRAYRAMIAIGAGYFAAGLPCRRLGVSPRCIEACGGGRADR
jgi:hypothetical protein